MWVADSLIMDGICSADGFWYFQLWLIGQGQHWYRLAARNPDNLPAVRALAGRRRSQWAHAEWPEWEELDYVAVCAHGHLTGQEDSLYDALDARGHVSCSSPAPTDSAWDFGNLTEIQRRPPRLAGLFPPSGTSRPEQPALKGKTSSNKRGPGPFDTRNRQTP
jgi:hypothetical protein